LTPNHNGIERGWFLPGARWGRRVGAYLRRWPVCDVRQMRHFAKLQMLPAKPPQIFLAEARQAC